MRHFGSPPSNNVASLSLLIFFRTLLIVIKMAANTKYQPAAQRDSFEESSYTQAPPSYQAEASHQDNLLGGPRGEDDNVPDDFKARKTL